MAEPEQEYDRGETVDNKKSVITGEDCVLEKKDMALLIEVEDTLADMDEALE